MPPFLNQSLFHDTPVHPAEVLARLVSALLLGILVAWIYRRSRLTSAATGSFPTTLVLLAVLIAMVTQVIGDNVARAFSLVGALSIVRFRTIVRDTEDTAYVIFAVAVGMAVGARDTWVALLGLGVIGVTAFIHKARSRALPESAATFELSVRLALGHEIEPTLQPALAPFIGQRQLVSLETSRQGLALDIAYTATLLPGASPEHLVKSLNRTEGIQQVQLRRRSPDLE